MPSFLATLAETGSLKVKPRHIPMTFNGRTEYSWGDIPADSQQTATFQDPLTVSSFVNPSQVAS